MLSVQKIDLNSRIYQVANIFSSNAAEAAGICFVLVPWTPPHIATGGSDSSAVPQATGSTAPSTTTHPSSSKKKTNVGAIVGGVVGGVGGLTLISGVVFWLLRQRQIASSQATSGTYDLSYEKPVMGPMDTGNTGTAFVSTPTPKLYVRFSINRVLTNNL